MEISFNKYERYFVGREPNENLLRCSTWPLITETKGETTIMVDINFAASIERRALMHDTNGGENGDPFFSTNQIDKTRSLLHSKFFTIWEILKATRSQCLPS